MVSGFYSMLQKLVHYYTGNIRIILLILGMALCFSCQPAKVPDKDSPGEPKAETIVKRRENGTVSSVNQVDENNRVHGIRATYYEDGTTLYSKQTFDHGKKQGPAVWYYTNGQIFKQSNFEDGKRHGLTRVYYKNGDLSAEFESEHGKVLPGLKEYRRDGTPVSSYPEVTFREMDLRAASNRVDLEISCTKKRSGVKFYILKEEQGSTDRIYLITKNDAALLQYYVKPGEALDEHIEILAEIPTELGNVLVKKYSYQLCLTN